MTRSGRIDVPAARLPTCCAAIAGVLAEHAITRLIIESAGRSPRTLLARQTDLPGELLQAQPCTLRAEHAPQLQIQLDSTAVHWSTDDESLADSLTRSLTRALT